MNVYWSGDDWKCCLQAWRVDNLGGMYLWLGNGKSSRLLKKRWRCVKRPSISL